MHTKNIFYRQYVSQTEKQVAPPLLYRLLERFAVHRIDVISNLLPPKNSRLLDIGCSSGSFLIKNKAKITAGVGIDVVQELLDEAKKNAKTTKLQFLQLDAGREALPFKAGQFSTVTAIATLQYLIDLDLVFEEVHRVLKPGGVFIFEVPNFLVFWRRLQLLGGNIPHTSQFQEGWNAGIIHVFAEPKLTQFATKKGFTVRSVTCAGIFAQVRSLFPSLLGADLIYVCQKR